MISVMNKNNHRTKIEIVIKKIWYQEFFGSYWNAYPIILKSWFEGAAVKNNENKTKTAIVLVMGSYKGVKITPNHKKNINHVLR